MRLLLDNNLSPKLVEPLVAAGHDVAHVRDHGMASADDPSVLALAVETLRVLVSADSDFGTYGWAGTVDEVLGLVDTRLSKQVEVMRAPASAGDPAYQAMLRRGQDQMLQAARQDLRNV
jgi:Domain of unknown function (DUF5615)